MEDFRVGSVPSSDPYGNRQPYGSTARKRAKHRGDESGPEEPEDTLELHESGDSPADGETIQDYYKPSDPDADS